MYISIGCVAALASFILPIAFAAPTPESHILKLRNPEARDVKPDSYIVVYKPSVNATGIAAIESVIESSLAKRDGEFDGISAKYELGSFKGFAIEADAATIAELAASEDVSVCLFATV